MININKESTKPVFVAMSTVTEGSVVKFPTSHNHYLVLGSYAGHVANQRKDDVVMWNLATLEVEVCTRKTMAQVVQETSTLTY